MYGSAPEAVQRAVPRRSVIRATTTMRRNASGVVREFHFPSAPSAEIAVNDTTITRRIPRLRACQVTPPGCSSFVTVSGSLFVSGPIRWELRKPRCFEGPGVDRAGRIGLRNAILLLRRLGSGILGPGGTVSLKKRVRIPCFPMLGFAAPLRSFVFF